MVSGLPVPNNDRTPARNLRIIREARSERGEADPWAESIERELARKAER
jgi:hypothetical protein